MNTHRRTAVIVGAFFLIAMVTSLAGGIWLESILGAPDLLSNVSANRVQVLTGSLLELINCLAVVGIAVAMFPIFKKHGEALALGYVAFRVIEAAVLVVAALSPLALILLSEQYLAAGSSDASSFQALGALLMAVRAQLAGLLVPIFFGVGALLFYSLLYRSRLVPRFISVWGLIAVVSLLAWNLLETFDMSISAGMVFGLPIILNEIFLGIWLIARGFNPKAQVSESPWEDLMSGKRSLKPVEMGTL
jgi:Domain of unknown function (DUF4386)